MKKQTTQTNISNNILQKRIFVIRGLRVMLDRDLAELYGVPTKALNQAVKRNQLRFPKDFMFRLTEKEKNEVVTNCDHLENLRFSSTLPHVFTEYGALMLANVLNSERAIKMSIFIVRAFIKFRDLFSQQKELFRRLLEIEEKIGQHDKKIKNILSAILRLMTPVDETEENSKRRIGFSRD